MSDLPIWEDAPLFVIEWQPSGGEWQFLIRNRRVVAFRTYTEAELFVEHGLSPYGFEGDYMRIKEGTKYRIVEFRAVSQTEEP